ncbi:MAG: exosortase/archaeosortase family protein [Candidatus Brocadiaceae bacterium]|nr:exosortase/archaeosortase family protein [Candidatus Brocadiaceae bacterium]
MLLKSPLIIRFSILFVLLLCAYYPVISGLVSVWLSDSNNSHGLLVPLIAGYLAYQKIDDLKKYIADMGSVQHRFWTTTFGLIIFAGSLLLYVLFYIGHVEFVSRLMFVLSLISLVWYYFGLRLVIIILFPLLFLFFMIPVPDSFISHITLPMKVFATNVAVPLMKVFGVLLVQEGNIIHLSTCTLEVAEACSGIRSLTSMLMLGCFFAYMTKGTNYKKVILVLCAPLIAILANVLRITGTGILASKYGETVARGYVHDISGYLVFIFGFAGLFFLFKLLNIGTIQDESK